MLREQNQLGHNILWMKKCMLSAQNTFKTEDFQSENIILYENICVGVF